VTTLFAAIEPRAQPPLGGGASLIKNVSKPMCFVLHL